MSPETIELTERAQAALADAARTRRQIAENLQAMKGEKERLQEFAWEYEEALQVRLPSEEAPAPPQNEPG
jgi:hypothetical protein